MGWWLAARCVRRREVSPLGWRCLLDWPVDCVSLMEALLVLGDCENSTRTVEISASSQVVDRNDRVTSGHYSGSRVPSLNQPSFSSTTNIRR